MLGIFLLESQARGEKGVVPGGVYQFFRAPFVLAPVFIDRLHAHVVVKVALVTCMPSSTSTP